MKKLHLKHTEYKRLEKSFGEWLDVLGYAEQTVYSLPNLLREFFYFLEQRAVFDLDFMNPQLVQDYFFYLHHRPNQRLSGGLSQSHLNKHRQALKKFGEYLQQSQNIILPISIKPLVLNPESIVVLSKKEVHQLYESTAKEKILKWRDLATLEIYYSCGLRRREGVKLNVRDVDLHKKRLHVRYGKGYKERLVPFTDQTANYFSQYLKQFRDRVISKDEKALLVNTKGKRITGQSLLLRLKKLQRNTDNEILMNKQIGLHTLRHSIATHLLQSGMEMNYIQQFLGHASLESTQIYTHIKPP